MFEEFRKRVNSNLDEEREQLSNCCTNMNIEIFAEHSRILTRRHLGPVQRMYLHFYFLSVVKIHNETRVEEGCYRKRFIAEQKERK